MEKAEKMERMEEVVDVEELSTKALSMSRVLRFSMSPSVSSKTARQARGLRQTRDPR